MAKNVKTTILEQKFIRIAGKVACSIQIHVQCIPPKDMIISRKVLKFQVIVCIRNTLVSN